MPSGAQVTNGLLVNSFETSADLLRFTRNNCSVSSSTEGVTDGQKAALVVFSNVDWPNLHFKVGTGFANGDWRGWGAVAVDILNTNPASVTVDIRVDDDLSADGAKHCQTGSIGVPAGQKATVVMPLSKSVPPGMRGGPPIAPDVTPNECLWPLHRPFAHCRFPGFPPQTGQANNLVSRQYPPAASDAVERLG
jgi:hypothetical protein